MPKTRRRVPNSQYKRKKKQKGKKIEATYLLESQPLVRQNWQHDQTIKRNMERLGLVMNLNPKMSGIAAHKRFWEDKKAIEALPPDELEALAEQILAKHEDIDPDMPEDWEVAEASHPLLVVPQAKKKEKNMFDDKREYYLPLIQKYGENYEAMERDMKLNYNQELRSKLRKNCLLYKEVIKKGLDGHAPDRRLREKETPEQRNTRIQRKQEYRATYKREKKEQSKRAERLETTLKPELL